MISGDIYINNKMADVDLEKRVLSACALPGSNAIDTVAGILMPDDFYRGSHQLIYTAMLQLYNKNIVIDIPALSTQMEKNGTLDSVGGPTELMFLVGLEFTAVNVRHHCETIKGKATLRRLLETGQNIIQYAKDGVADPQAAVQSAQQALDLVSTARQVEYTSIGSLAKARAQEILALTGRRGEITNLQCGFPDVDDKLGGLRDGAVYIIAARPGMGKTALAVNMAVDTAIRRHRSTAVFSLEMTSDQLVDRMIYGYTRMSERQIRYTDATHKAQIQQRLDSYTGAVVDAPLYLCGSDCSTVQKIRTACRSIQHRHGLDLVVIDYLQLMHGSAALRRSGNRVLEISEITRQVKLLAQELSVPIILLSQLSRATETRDKKRPVLSDIRESGSAEQDADVVMFIYREDYYRVDGTPMDNLADLIVAKNRYGATGTVKLGWDGKTFTFFSLAKAGQVPA